MRRDEYVRTRAGLDEMLGGQFDLQVVGDGQMSLVIPENAMPGLPGKTIESASPEALLRDCQQFLLETYM